MALVPCSGHSWYDPYYCCGGQDCGPIVNELYFATGERYITIQTIEGKLLSAMFPKNFPIQPSLDSKDHACILADGRPRCLYLTAGT